MRWLLPLCSAAWLWAQPPAEFFEQRIRPVLAEKCYGCHGAGNASSNLALDSRESAGRGGKRGTLLVSGDPDSSLIIRALSYRDPQLKMPPTGQLPEAVVADFREWIRHGGSYPAPAVNGNTAPKHWSFQPIRDPTPPLIAHRVAASKNPIDAFLAARRTRPTAGPAARRDLLRRVTFDLTGLPPAPEQIASFLRDPSSGAFRRVVERLLASPHYGERWGRHWLDVVRFAETNGHEFDFYKFEAWRYRDYVIRAFNQDVPYDRFVAEHIAGDLLPAPRLAPDGLHSDSPIGSGFLGVQEERNGATDLEEVRAEMRASKIDVFGKAFLGLTIACARCHDHKFDPITTADYYALGGIFDSTRDTLGSIESPELARRTEEIVAAAARPTAKRLLTIIGLRPTDVLFEDFEDPALPRWHRSGAAFRVQAPGLLDSSRQVSDKLTGILVSRSFVPVKTYIHVRLAGTKFKPVREAPSQLAVTICAAGRYPKAVAGDGDRTLRWKTITLKEEINQTCHLEIADRRRDGHLAVDAIVFSQEEQPPETANESLAPVATVDLPLPEEPFGRVSYEDTPHNLRLHIRGSHLSLGEEVPRALLPVAGVSRAVEGSGRLALAESLGSRSNPLVARVMVNRIWQHHFGDGLVTTVDNFGRTGERPSHPELLDWLASRFIQSGWSVKAMHRLILDSAAYQLASTPPAGARELDPRNRQLSHMPVRRLDAESVRDAILAVSGSLDPTVHGPSITPHISPWQDGRGKPASGPLDGHARRSIYLEVRRNFLTPMLLAFDYPLPTTTVGRRMVSSVPSQALVMMNNEFVASEAQKWAVRAEAEFHDPGERVTAMFIRAFSRPPEAAERRLIEAFLQQANGTWAELAHVLLNRKEVIFLR